MTAAAAGPNNTASTKAARTVNGREHDAEQHGTEEDIQHDQPPRLVVEVDRGDAECGSQLHPLTPEAATPATK